MLQNTKNQKKYIIEAQDPMHDIHENKEAIFWNVRQLYSCFPLLFNTFPYLNPVISTIYKLCMDL